MHAVTILEHELLIFLVPVKFTEGVSFVIEHLDWHSSIEQPKLLLLSLVSGAHHLNRALEKALLSFGLVWLTRIYSFTL